MRKDTPPLELDFLNGVHIELPGDYILVPLIDEYAAYIISLGAGLSVESWLQNAYQVVERSGLQKHISHTLGSSLSISKQKT